MKIKKIYAVSMAIIMGLALCACAGQTKNEMQKEASVMRTIKDSMEREVEIPDMLDSIVCIGVGALRYSCYMDAQDLVIGVEDYETEKGMSRLYNYVNYDKFKDLPVIGSNGEPNVEEIIKVSPQVIVMSSYANIEADDLQAKVDIPVVVVPGSDTTLDDKAYETIRIMGELYGKEERAEKLTAYLKEIEKDLDSRTSNISEEEKPSVYVGGVSFKGVHGFEGTEAYYGPFELIHAKNLANETDQKGAFDADLEKVLSWNPDIIFLDFNGMSLINENYVNNEEYYKNLSAVKNGNVYSQISFRSWSSNLETALADAYYAASVIYSEQFADLNLEEKVGEIFMELLGVNPYDDLKEAGYEFRQITIGE